MSRDFLKEPLNEKDIESFKKENQKMKKYIQEKKNLFLSIKLIMHH